MFSNLPTDNLYKFMALLGVAFVLFSFYFVYTKAHTNAEKAEEVSLEMKILTLEIKQAQELTEDLKKLQNSTQEEIKELKKIENDIERKKLLLDGKNLMSALLNYRSKNITLQGQMLLIVGLVLMFAGFYLWYSRVQRYQDIAIQSNKKSDLSPA